MVRVFGLLLFTLLPLSLVQLALTQAVFAESDSNKSAESYGLAVIVHPSNRLDNMSAEEVQKIYSGEKLRWDSGGRITVINSAKDTRARGVFYESVLGVSKDHIFRYQNRRKVFKTLQFSTSEEIIETVSELPGAVGYVPTENLEKSVKKVYESK